MKNEKAEDMKEDEEEIKEEMIEKRLCATEVYKWLRILRTTTLFGVVFSLVISAVAYLYVDFSFITSIFAVAFFSLVLRRAVTTIKYIEQKYGIRGKVIA